MAHPGETPDTTEGLDLTGRVIREAIRLYSPGWLLTRVTTTDTELGGHRLPRGTTVVYSPYLLQRQDRYYPDPLRFDPDRWLAHDPRHSPFLAFGAGPRRCVGEEFGLTESTLLLATLIRRWNLTPVPGRPVREVPLATLRPGPVWMHTSERIPDRPPNC
ncbi:cytochrome P450 [Streptomyces sp. NPDC059816]|uniref:cytochrome P450 n=1 Tax=Streptomyces sp. NPDC059816 TaxID=3346960 RepID=UPI003669A6BA